MPFSVITIIIIVELFQGHEKWGPEVYAVVTVVKSKRENISMKHVTQFKGEHGNCECFLPGMTVHTFDICLTSAFVV